VLDHLVGEFAAVVGEIRLGPEGAAFVGLNDIATGAEDIVDLADDIGATGVLDHLVGDTIVPIVGEVGFGASDAAGIDLGDVVVGVVEVVRDADDVGGRSRAVPNDFFGDLVVGVVDVGGDGLVGAVAGLARHGVVIGIVGELLQADFATTGISLPLGEQI